MYLTLKKSNPAYLFIKFPKTGDFNFKVAKKYI